MKEETRQQKWNISEDTRSFASPIDRMTLIIVLASLCILSIYAVKAQDEETASYEPVYQDLIEHQPVYETIAIPYHYPCVLGYPALCYDTRYEDNIIGYDDVVIGEQIVGVTDGINIIYGYVYENSAPQMNSRTRLGQDRIDIPSAQQPQYTIFKYYQGERNTEDPELDGSHCRQYEIDKGVCYEIY